MPAWHDPLTLLAAVTTPADAEAVLQLVASGAGTVPSSDAYATLPGEDRLSGAGSGRILACFVYPAAPARFTDGLRGGTYFATADLTTAIAETMHHFAADIASSGASVGAARPIIGEMQVIEALLLGVFHELRPCRVMYAALYHPTDYEPSWRYGATIRSRDVDGILYESVRNPATGQCAAVFRPRALRHAVNGARLRYEWRGPGRVVVHTAP